MTLITMLATENRRSATVLVIKPGQMHKWHSLRELITMHCYQRDIRCDGYHMKLSYHEATFISKTGISYITARPARAKDDPVELEDRFLDFIHNRLIDEGWRFGHQVHLFPQPTSEGVPA